MGFPGARFWGQVRGSSGRLRIVQGKGNERRNQPDCRESALASAFPRSHRRGANHGKEGVDGSSPSEGFEKLLLISPFRLPGSRPVLASTSTERPPSA